jgi:hypothetical protein
MKEKRELESIPAQFAALEAEKEIINTQLADLEQCRKPGFVNSAKNRLSEIETQIATLFARWEELEKLSTQLPRL